MRIERLAPSTSRLLGSMSITSPMSLVKELLDNSIDAEATSVEILISHNTIDKIEVRDNGVGINPDDYHCLGRPGHTSKLKSFEELNIASARTLGFRGDALSSINNVATVTITTRRASDPVACHLEISPGQGGVLSQKPVSAPVGTTVTAMDLFGRFPVRARQATKEAPKVISQIKKLMHSYAVARPALRLSLKVLDNAHLSWSYSPKPGAQAKEAILQILGVEGAAQCYQKVVTVSYEEHTNAQYTFEAYVMKPDSDILKTPKHQYFSVDGRPVTSKKGIMKKLLSTYLEHLSPTFHNVSSRNNTGSCFLRLNIICPPGSYDANIEPTKDEILFIDEKFVQEQFEKLCKGLYQNVVPQTQVNAGSPDTRETQEETKLDLVDLPSMLPNMPPNMEASKKCSSTSWAMNMLDNFSRLARSPVSPLITQPTIPGAEGFEPNTPSQKDMTEGYPILRQWETGPRDLDMAWGQQPQVYQFHAPRRPAGEDQLHAITRTNASEIPNKPCKRTRNRRELPFWTPPSSIESSRQPGLQKDAHPPKQTTLSFGSDNAPSVNSFVPINPSASIQRRSPNDNDEQQFKTSLPSGDPRAYLLRRQKSNLLRPNKLRRLQSCLMPLETTPIAEQTHDASQVTLVDFRHLIMHMKMVQSYDQYISEGASVNGLEMTLADSSFVDERLRVLIPSETAE